MKSSDRCPMCGGELIERQVEKLLPGGRHTAAITVLADICLRCGQRIYAPKILKKFEEIRSKLERDETAELQRSARLSKCDDLVEYASNESKD